MSEFQAKLEASLAELGTKLDTKIAQSNQLAEEKISSKFMGELKGLSDQYKELQDEITSIAQNSYVQTPSKPQSLGKQFANSESFKGFASGLNQRAGFDFQANTIISGGDDVIVPQDRREGIVGGPLRQLSILDFVPKGTTNSDLVRYTKELAFTSNAAETAQGALKPESNMTFEPKNTDVVTIPSFIKVSKQVMADAPAVETYVNSRLVHGVRQRLDSQIINGDGTGQNISGVLANSTAYAGASGMANAFDYTNGGKYAVMTSDYQPDFWFMNPADWGGQFERVKRGASDAAYVGASGAVSYVNNGLTPLLWGLPVITSNAVPVGTVIGGSSDAMMLWMREDMRIEAFEQDGDNVQRNLVTIRAEMRAAFTVFRDDALITLDLTSLPIA